MTTTPPSELLGAVIPPCGIPATRVGAVAESVIGVALRLAGIIHDDDPAEGAALVAGLDDEQRTVLPFVLAALVDVDKTASEMLGWLGWTTPGPLGRLTAVAPAYALQLQPRPTNSVSICGTRDGWRAHHRDGDEPCEACRIGNDAWVRTCPRPGRLRDAVAA